MPKTNVLVATTLPDLKAEVIAAAVAARSDMVLVKDGPVAARDVARVLDSLGGAAGCALLIVGDPNETYRLSQQWLTKRSDLVVLCVDVVGDNVRFELHDPRLAPLLTALRTLAESSGPEIAARVAVFRLSTHDSLLQASIRWVHGLLRDAVARIPDENGDLHGLSVTRATLLQSLDDSLESTTAADHETESALDRELAVSDPSQESAAVAAHAFGLEPLEFRLMVLALAPELDFRFQRCMGFLLDDMSRRVGTLSLYHSLLGLAPSQRAQSPGTDAFTRWSIFEEHLGRPATADEPLRLDPYLAQWLLGQKTALANDPRVRRLMRLLKWPGTCVLSRWDERAGLDAERIIERLHSPDEAHWIVLGGNNAPTWRALLELGAQNRQLDLIRIDPTSLAGVDLVEVEECAKRIGRMSRLTGNPLAIDLTKSAGLEGEDDRIQLLLGTLNGLGCGAALICTRPARIVRLLGSAPHELVEGPALSTPARIAVVRAAAKGADAYLSEDTALSMANRYPLQVDGLEQAMHLAASRPKDYTVDDPGATRFTTACKELVSEDLSRLAERMEPIFDLEHVVLPADRKTQLHEIVDQVRLAPWVLDEWKFRDQLPYGRGVAALFTGPSGTGKTMAAMGVARALGIQILRLDLSRVVSKYIGETEKNIDRVFEDAQQSGSAVVIDEADALLGKRSEVKDAHDRYANIEVAYLLQRLEAYDGLAILTTNMRQNIDAAFVRRLRFIVDFPRPDTDARELIWRQCLPAESHALTDGDYRQLARKVDITGGQIRQITLRAAFIAATAHVLIDIRHIAQAVRAELAKIGMPPIELDITKTRLFA